MGDNALPAEVERFVRDFIPSINHLEGLIQFVRAPDRSLSIAEVAEAMHVEVGTVEAITTDLVRFQLVGPDGDAFRFAPATPDLAARTAELADAYGRFPVQLIRVIYQQPPTPVQSFADAFRLRKD